MHHRLAQITSLLILALCLAPTASHAQPESSFSIVTEGPLTELDRRARQALREQLSVQEASAPLVDWRLLYDVVKVTRDGEENQVALSVTAMARLPEEVLEMAGQEEAFYLMNASNREEELPPEGEHVREYMSTEWMRQYYHVKRQYLRVVEASQLEQAAASIVEDMLQEERGLRAE